jgi:hypothetical protein
VLSRREFVGALALPLSRARAPECRIVDLGHACVLRESLAGFRGIGIPACGAFNRQECLFYIVAGVGALSESVAQQLAALAHAGGWVIFESAAGFGGFEEQRRHLADHFGLEIDRPIHLPPDRIPYIDFRWPVKVKVRDFSHIVPVRAAPSEVIASAGGCPIAARRGRFVFLGSLIGPALLAGDREAILWVKELTRRKPAS